MGQNLKIRQSGFTWFLTGAIRDEILPKEDVVIYALKWLAANEPERLKERYAPQTVDGDPYALLTQIAAARRHLNKQGKRIFPERSIW